MSLPEDLKAELERALPCLNRTRGCPAPDGFSCHYCCARAAVQPILERLVAERHCELPALVAKLAAAEAGREGWQKAAQQNLDDLKKAEALLARRPHLLDPDYDYGLMCDTEDDKKFCARLGGACAK